MSVQFFVDGKAIPTTHMVVKQVYILESPRSTIRQPLNIMKLCMPSDMAKVCEILC